MAAEVLRAQREAALAHDRVDDDEADERAIEDQLRAGEAVCGAELDEKTHEREQEPGDEHPLAAQAREGDRHRRAKKLGAGVPHPIARVRKPEARQRRPPSAGSTWRRRNSWKCQTPSSIGDWYGPASLRPRARSAWRPSCMRWQISASSTAVSLYAARSASISSGSNSAMSSG